MDTLQFWIKSSQEAIDTARELYNSKRYVFSLFFLHLATEKALKALYISKNNTSPLPIHDLLRLAKSAGFDIDQDISQYLIEISTFNIAARYDEYKFKLHQKATPEYTQEWLSIGETIFKKIITQIWTQQF